MSGPLDGPLRDPLLDALGIAHGFGQRETTAPSDAAFPKQVHGIAVHEHRVCVDPRVDADAILTREAGASIGIVTADCVPILVAHRDGDSVAAIHAGWRGLAAGVIEAGVRAVAAGGDVGECVAAIGPAARGCCYEVDEPVRAGLRERYATLLDGVLVPGRAGRFQLDLPVLAGRVLEKNGVEKHQIGTAARLCTICAPDRFESYRRDGSAAGRLRHFITRPAAIPRQG
jgi:hypothetical protein